MLRDLKPKRGFGGSTAAPFAGEPKGYVQPMYSFTLAADGLTLDQSLIPTLK